MIDNAFFKPGVGVVDSITGRVLYPKAFGVAGYGVFDFNSGRQLFTEAELLSIQGSYLPIEDINNPTNKLKRLFDNSLGSSSTPVQPYRRPRIVLTKTQSNIERDRSLEEMANQIGMLIQPYTYIKWGSSDIEPHWINNLQFEWGEDETPGGITFMLDPMAPTADLPMGKDGEGAEIYFEIGYTKKRTLSGTLYHTGSTLESGNSMSISIEGSHKSFTADQTPARNRYFVGQNKEIEVFNNAKEVLSPYNIKCKVEVPEKEKYKFRTSSQAETDMRYVLRTNQAYGLTTQYSFNKKADMIIRPASIKKRTAQLKLAKASGETDHEESEVFYLGPGLITTITRRTIARKVSSAPAKDKLASKSNASVDVKEAPAKDPIKKQSISGVSDNVGAIKDTQIVKTNKLKNKKGGDPTGPAAKQNKPLSPNESKDIDKKDTSLEKEVNENKKEKLEQGQVELSTSFLMVPRMVGIKPGDVVVIMWMEEGDELYQDFLIKSVSYSQEGAMYRVSIEGSRWLREKPMVENWDGVLANMKKLGLLAGSGQSYGQNLYGDVEDYYPRYKNWISYYWGES